MNMEITLALSRQKKGKMLIPIQLVLLVEHLFKH